jgi:hypothetical protein
MTDIVGRDKNVQHGDKSTMKIDNRLSSGETIWKGIVVTVVGGIILYFVVEYLL